MQELEQVMVIDIIPRHRSDNSDQAGTRHTGAGKITPGRNFAFRGNIQLRQKSPTPVFASDPKRTPTALRQYY